MKKKNQTAEDQGIRSVMTLKLVWCSKQSRHHGMNQLWQDVLGEVFSWSTHLMEIMPLLREETENFSWTTVCKTKLILLRQNFFSFQIVNLSINVTHVVV